MSIIKERIQVRYYADLKYSEVVDVGHILNIGVGKDHRGNHVSVITIALQDGRVVTTTEAHVKVVTK